MSHRLLEARLFFVRIGKNLKDLQVQVLYSFREHLAPSYCKDYFYQGLRCGEGLLLLHHYLDHVFRLLSHNPLDWVLHK